MKNLIVKLYLLLALYGGYFGVSYADVRSTSCTQKMLYVIAPYNILSSYGGVSSLATTLDIEDPGGGGSGRWEFKPFAYDIKSGLYAIAIQIKSYDVIISVKYDLKLNGKSISGFKDLPNDIVCNGNDVYILLKPTGNDITATTISDWSYVPKP